MENNLRNGPLILAGILLGAGLGGFVDGIVFHQILQLHNMLSAKLVPNNLIDAKINMFWDGVFHAGVWIMTAAGLAMLFRAGKNLHVPWSGKMLFGSLLFGWGLFNIIEGIINHHILEIHHVIEYTSNHLPGDIGFLCFSLLLLGIGGAFIYAGMKTSKNVTDS